MGKESENGRRGIFKEEANENEGEKERMTKGKKSENIQWKVWKEMEGEVTKDTYKGKGKSADN